MNTGRNSKQTTCLCRDTGGKGTLPAQHTTFNTLDNWGHKTPTQSKRKRTGKKRLYGHGPKHVYNTLGYIKKIPSRFWGNVRSASAARTLYSIKLARHPSSMVLGATELSPFLLFLLYIYISSFLFLMCSSFCWPSTKQQNILISRCDNPVLHPCLEKATL